jgi:probable F420-dependent oxidoreductase
MTSPSAPRPDHEPTAAPAPEAASDPAARPALGTIGVWSALLRIPDPTDPAEASQGAAPEAQARHGEIREAAAELEELGYGTLWLGGSPAPNHAGALLAATSRITVATGILNLWQHEAPYVAERHAALNAEHGGRFLLGLGVSHSRLVPGYHRPYSAMQEYLTGLDAAPAPVPAGQRVLAALGPKMLELSRDRAAGAHPYLVTPEYVAAARTILGKDAVLAPDLKIVLDPDLDRARAIARDYLAGYLAMPNYTNNFLRLGFTADDFRDGGSDRLISGVFALGDTDAVRRRVDEYLAAGADHLAVQAVTADFAQHIPRAEWRTLAEALPLAGG